MIKELATKFGLAGGGGSESFDFDSGSSFNSYDSWSDGSSYSSSNSFGSSRILAGILVFALLLTIIKLAWQASTFRKSINAVPKRIKSSVKKARLNQTLLSLDHNSTELEKEIHAEAERLFLDYQTAWSKNDISRLKDRMSPEYFRHASLLMEAMRTLGRRNVVKDVKISKIVLHTSVAQKTDLPIQVKVLFSFSALDQFLDVSLPYSVANPKILHSDKHVATLETWYLSYDGKNLRLDLIQPSTISNQHLSSSLQHFAEENLLSYSPDFGRALLPEKGLIFFLKTFASADINNHIIGKWGNVLIQLYSYSADPAKTSSYYLVGQLTLPKSYGGIQIIPKGSPLVRHREKEYEKFDLEWEEFNQRYAVFAPSQDALTAFELVNPKFMEFLYNICPTCAIEVAGKDIFFFLPEMFLNEKDYKALLDVLVLAYKTLKQ